MVKQRHLYMFKGDPCFTGLCSGLTLTRRMSFLEELTHRAGLHKKEHLVFPALTLCLTPGQPVQASVTLESFDSDLLCFDSLWTTGQNSANGG